MSNFVELRFWAGSQCQMSNAAIGSGRLGPTRRPIGTAAMSQGMSEADKNISLLNIADLSVRHFVGFFGVPDVLFQGQAIAALWMLWRDQGPLLPIDL